MFSLKGLNLQSLKFHEHRIEMLFWICKTLIEKKINGFKSEFLASFICHSKHSNSFNAPKAKNLS